MYDDQQTLAPWNVMPLINFKYVHPQTLNFCPNPLDGPSWWSHWTRQLAALFCKLTKSRKVWPAGWGARTDVAGQRLAVYHAPLIQLWQPVLLVRIPRLKDLRPAPVSSSPGQPSPAQGSSLWARSVERIGQP